MSIISIHGKKRLTAAMLAGVILGAAALAGCGGATGEASKATADSVVKETQVVTQVVNGVYVDKDGNAITDPSGNPIKATDAPKTTAPAKQTSKAQSATTANKQQSAAANNNNNNNKTQQSAAGNNNNTNNNNNNSGSSAERKTTPSGAQAGNTTKKSQQDNSASDLTVGGKHYKVGDKVTCTYYLLVPNMMLNFQGRVEFDSAMLKLEDAYLVAPANFSAILNNNLDNRVVFNGSQLSGYDFTSPGYEFLTVEYTAQKTGTVEPSITFEVITDTSDKAYASDNGVLSGGAKVWAVYS